MPTELSEARVLVADDAPTVRQSVRLTLAQAGITRADTANSIGETRRRVRSGAYDVVLCDYHFGEGMNGQELLEELRRSGELPLSTIWFMITAEASYEKVVSNIHKYGNTTAASIPIGLCEAWEQGRIKEGDLIAIAGFGSGFMWASALIRW